jgi:REP element-mobilizing transposase RayT
MTNLAKVPNLRKVIETTWKIALQRFLNLCKAGRMAMKHIAGGYYHIYNRGVEKRKIFANEENYLFLLRRAREFLPAYAITLFAYCLMPNHYHFLIRTDEDGSIGPFLQRLFNSYTQAFNKQENRSGTLFEGRAQSILIDGSGYLFHICRYIHLNPVLAGLVEKPEDWLYSNYQEFIGLRQGTLSEAVFVKEQFGTSHEYRKFVENYIPHAIERKLAKYMFD